MWNNSSLWFWFAFPSWLVETIYRLNAISVKIQHHFFTEIEKNPKVCTELQRLPKQSLDPYLPHYTKNNLKWVNDLNARPETVKFPQKKSKKENRLKVLAAAKLQGHHLLVICSNFRHMVLGIHWQSKKEASNAIHMVWRRTSQLPDGVQLGIKSF